MFWNHRVFKVVNHGEEELYIREVYYNDDGSIMGWTEREEVWGEDIEVIRKTLNWMLECLEKPVLDEAELLRKFEEARGDESTSLFSEPTVSFDSVEDFLAELDREDEDGQ